MEEYLKALKDGKQLTITTITEDYNGRNRQYIDNIIRITDYDTLNYFKTSELYTMNSKSLCSSNLFYDILSVQKTLEFMRNNCRDFNITIGA